MGWLRNLFRRGKRTSTSEERVDSMVSTSTARASSAASSVCDVCNAALARQEGYLLTTRQVVLAEAYWIEQADSMRKLSANLMPSHEAAASLARESVQGMVPQMAGQCSAWAVCPECIGLFAVDRDTAQEFARTNTVPPGCGPVAVGECMPVVSRALSTL